MFATCTPPLEGYRGVSMVSVQCCVPKKMFLTNYIKPPPPLFLSDWAAMSSSTAADAVQCDTPTSAADAMQCDTPTSGA